MNSTALNLFYEEPDTDRWFKYDRYPRRIIRRIVRGKERPGGVMLVALNLMAGLDRLKVPYRFNDYRYIKKHPEELACIIGKPHLLYEKPWKNPVLLGAGIFSHPTDSPDIFKKYPNLKQVLVPGEWMREMCEPFYGDKVSAWPTGIDTEKWKPFPEPKMYDFLIYDKVRWEYDQHEKALLYHLKNTLDKRGLNFQLIRYGNYSPSELREKLRVSKAAIFLCEHETQGLAYQQILSCNIPVLAWDQQGYWKDPAYYPHRVRYKPVSSVPYWDDRCGLKFRNRDEFEPRLTEFLQNLDSYKPRDYIMENLTLEICAQKYLDIYHEVLRDLALQPLVNK